jgi:hypothetical protein
MLASLSIHGLASNSQYPYRQGIIQKHFPEMGQIVLEVGDPSVREIYEGQLISTRANQAELKRFQVELGFIDRFGVVEWS